MTDNPEKRKEDESLLYDMGLQHFTTIEDPEIEYSIMHEGGMAHIEAIQKAKNTVTNNPKPTHTIEDVRGCVLETHVRPGIPASAKKNQEIIFSSFQNHFRQLDLLKSTDVSPAIRANSLEQLQSIQRIYYEHPLTVIARSNKNKRTTVKVDLTYRLKPGMFKYPSNEELTVRSTDASVDNQGICNRSAGADIALLNHHGTHIDAPAHKIPGGKTIDM